MQTEEQHLTCFGAQMTRNVPEGGDTCILRVCGYPGEGLAWTKVQRREITGCVHDKGKQLVLLEHKQTLET